LRGGAVGRVVAADERDLGAVVGAACGVDGAGVGEGGVEDEAPGGVAGFDVEARDEGRNLQLELRLDWVGWGLRWVGAFDEGKG